MNLKHSAKSPHIPLASKSHRNGGGKRFEQSPSMWLSAIPNNATMKLIQAALRRPQEDKVLNLYEILWEAAARTELTSRRRALMNPSVRENAGRPDRLDTIRFREHGSAKRRCPGGGHEQQQLRSSREVPTTSIRSPWHRQSWRIFTYGTMFVPSKSQQSSQRQPTSVKQKQPSAKLHGPQ